MKNENIRETISVIPKSLLPNKVFWAVAHCSSFLFLRTIPLALFHLFSHLLEIKLSSPSPNFSKTKVSMNCSPTSSEYHFLYKTSFYLIFLAKSLNNSRYHKTLLPDPLRLLPSWFSSFSKLLLCSIFFLMLSYPCSF